MVLKDSQDIERQCLTVLDFDLSALELCMKGQRVNVEAARRQVHRLIMGQQNVDQANLSRRQSGLAAPGNVYQPHQVVQNFPRDSSLCDRDSGVLQDQSCDPFASSLKDVDNNVILEPSLTNSGCMRSYSLTTDADHSSSSFSLDRDLVARGSGNGTPKGLSRTFAQVVSLTDLDGKMEVETGGGSGAGETEHRVKDVVSDHSSTASSDEDSGVSVVDKSDPRYEVHLEFAVKLGYAECDLDKVINKHGLACDENRLLQELIEGSAGCGGADPESEEGLESLSPGLAVPDIASSEVFQGVLKKVNQSEDSGSNLRHIVIDGSNVAMR